MPIEEDMSYSVDGQFADLLAKVRFVTNRLTRLETTITDKLTRLEMTIDEKMTSLQKQVSDIQIRLQGYPE